MNIEGGPEKSQLCKVDLTSLLWNKFPLLQVPLLNNNLNLILYILRMDVMSLRNVC